jgi:hypothetical protein
VVDTVDAHVSAFGFSFAPKIFSRGSSVYSLFNRSCSTQVAQIVLAYSGMLRCFIVCGIRSAEAEWSHFASGPKFLTRYSTTACTSSSVPVAPFSTIAATSACQALRLMREDENTAVP